METATGLEGIVAIAGALIGAATAISLAWMRRARWMPPEEAVAGATMKVSALICAVIITAIFIFRETLGIDKVSLLALVTVIVTLVALVVSIRTNTQYSFTRRLTDANGAREQRVLGGHSLTEEAARIAKTKHLGHQQLYENSNYNADLVWTRSSLADVQVRSTLGFISLQVSGSVALAAIAIAFGSAVPPATDFTPVKQSIEEQGPVR